MATSDLRSEIGQLWHHVNREIHERVRHAFRDSDLTPMILMMIRIIEEHEGITVSELARRSNTVKSHVSKVIDQLVRQGYVEKRSDPSDQRLLRIYPTKAAGEIKEEMMKRARSAWSEALEGVPEAELESLATGLRSLMKAIDQSKNQD